MSLTVRKAEEHDQLAAALRFRGAVQAGDHLLRPDRDTAGLEHELDVGGVHLVARYGLTIVGTVRNNVGSDGSFGLYEDFHGLSAKSFKATGETSITSGLTVLRPYHRAMITERLAISAYQYALLRGVTCDFISSTHAMRPLFERLGYRENMPDTSHPEFAFRVSRLRLDLLDETHLTKTSSPLLPILRKFLRLPNHFKRGLDGMA